MNKIEIRGAIVPADYDIDFFAPYIDRGMITPESRVRAALAECDPDKTLQVAINSPGGSVFAGNEMINAMREWAIENGQGIEITVGALAASMAAAMVATLPALVRVHKNTKIMFHGAYTATIGGAQAHQDEAELLEKINADVKVALLNNTNLTLEVIDEWFDEGRAGWLTAEEAINVGLADEIIGAESSAIRFTAADTSSMASQGLDIAAFADYMTEGEDMSEQVETPAEELEVQEELPESPLADRIAELQKALEEARGEAGTRDIEIAALHQQIADMEDQERDKAGSHIAALQEANDEIAKQSDEISRLQNELETMQAELDEAETELEAAKQALANPAYADAAIGGESEPVETGASEEGTHSESADVSHLETYWGLQSDPQTRGEATTYWNENEAAIRAEMRERAEGEED